MPKAKVTTGRQLQLTNCYQAGFQSLTTAPENGPAKAPIRCQDLTLRVVELPVVIVQICEGVIVAAAAVAALLFTRLNWSATYSVGRVDSSRTY